VTPTRLDSVQHVEKIDLEVEMLVTDAAELARDFLSRRLNQG
jgi:hypothetical protein